MTMVNVMVADGGGGKDYSGQHLTIHDVETMSKKDILDKYGEYLLYETDIDVAALEEQLLAAKQTAGLAKEQMDTTSAAIEGTLKATNSKYLSESDSATEDFNNMKTATTDIGSIFDKLNDEVVIANMIERANNFNATLKELKKGARLKLLQKKADQINAAARVVSKSTSYIDYPTESWPYDSSYSSEDIYKISTHYTYIKMNDDGWTNRFRVDTTKTEYINYWGWIKSDFFLFTIFDDDIAKLEGKIKALGYTTGYSEEHIVD